MDFFSLCVLNFHYLTLTEMHLCLVKLSPTLELSMQAFFGVKLVYKYDKYKVATLFFNIGEKKTLQTSAVLTSVAAHILSVDIDQGSIP